MAEVKQNILGTDPIGRLLLKFSIPTALTLMVNTMYNIVDQIFIGHAAGISGVAATNVTFPIGIIAAALALMIGDGCAANVSLALGRKEQDEADKVFANAVVLLFLAGFLLAGFGLLFTEQLVVFFGASPSVVAESVKYMSITLLGQPFGMCNMAFTAIIRADGNPKYMMRSMMIGAALNVILDPIFIFYFGWGIQGAALATIIGQIVSGIIALAYLPRYQHFHLKKENLKLQGKVAGKIFKLGFPSLCTQTASAATQIIMNNLMRKYGAMTIYGSEIAISCYGLMMKLYQISHAMFVGLASGASPIHGFNFGAKQYDRVKQTIKIAAKASIMISMVWFFVFQLGGGFLASLFVEEEPLYQEFAVHCFRLYMAGFYVFGLPNVTSSFFQAIGNPKKALVVSLSRQVFFLIPLALLLSSCFGLDGALGAAPLADILTFALALTLLVKEIKGWKKKNMIS
ncbi:MAG: MATE family efflux transporter [Anaerotignum sp.]|nr:MATE family efflux transporter [Anaerotignum sp.]MBR6542532.1 MATE family efflux transporter [Anaerotignum sp.]